jgi:hypothetical protein
MAAALTFASFSADAAATSVWSVSARSANAASRSRLPNGASRITCSAVGRRRGSRRHQWPARRHGKYGLSSLAACSMTGCSLTTGGSSPRECSAAQGIRSPSWSSALKLCSPHGNGSSRTPNPRALRRCGAHAIRSRRPSRERLGFVPSHLTRGTQSIRGHRALLLQRQARQPAEACWSRSVRAGAGTVCRTLRRLRCPS